MKTIFISFLLLFSSAFSQSDIPISKYLNEVASGNTDKVRMILPDLMVEYPNDPGVKFLTAAVLSDAMKALDIYSDIVNNSPQSIWADDALYRIIQFNVVLGDNNAAVDNLNLLRNRYPTSEFIVPSADLVKTALGVKGDFKSTNVANINKDVNPEIKNINQEPKKIEQKNEDIIIIPSNTKVENKVAEVSENEATEEVNEMQNLAENLDTEVEENNDLDINGKDDIKIKEKPIEKVDKNEPKTENKDNAQQLKEILNKQIEKEKEAKKNLAVAENTPKKTETSKAKTEEVKTVDLTKKEENSVRWGLQVGIYETKEPADSEKNKFLSQRMRTEVMPRNIDGKMMYAVIVGHYTSKSNAEAAKIIINQQCNCNPIIIEK
jgi:cell division protein FtsN